MARSFVYPLLLGCLYAVPAPALASGEPTGAKPAGNPGEWLTTADYPAQALRSGEQGLTVFRVSVDPTGNVAGCQVVQSSGSKTLDDATCLFITKRARFAPAIDSDGHPVMGSFQSRVNWILPKTAYRPFTAGTTVRRMTIELNGKPTHCKAAGASVGGTQLVNFTCPDILYAPYRDTAGQPMRKMVTVTTITTVEDPPN